MAKHLYVWGSGGTGQLGLGNEEDHSLPQRWDDTQVQLELESVTSGGCHSAGVSTGGRLFLWGSNDRCQLGHAHSEQSLMNVCSPSQSVACIPAKSKTKLVACGWWSTIAAVSSGSDDGDQVLSWGANDHHQLGRTQSSENDTTLEPALVANFPLKLHVASVACGWKHSLLATCEGEVFAWGTGRHGQLGLGGDILKAGTPKRIEVLNDKTIAGVFCGWEHSVFRSSGGEVFTCGNNRHGQLGVQTANSVAAESSRERRKQVNALPLCVLDPNDKRSSLRTTQVGCGWHFVLCITVGGGLVAWGKGSHGQLGFGGFANTNEPMLVPFSESIRQIACGSEHSMVVTNSGELYTCGWGEHGNLGHGDNTNRASLEKVAFFANQQVCSIAGGGAVSIAVAGDRH